MEQYAAAATANKSSTQHQHPSQSQPVATAPKSGGASPIVSDARTRGKAHGPFTGPAAVAQQSLPPLPVHYALSSLPSHSLGTCSCVRWPCSVCVCLRGGTCPAVAMWLAVIVMSRLCDGGFFLGCFAVHCRHSLAPLLQQLLHAVALHGVSPSEMFLWCRLLLLPSRSRVAEEAIGVMPTLDAAPLLQALVAVSAVVGLDAPDPFSQVPR